MIDQPALRPRAERCPDPLCTDEQQCWRCDAEESQHALIASMSRCPECGTPVPPTHWTKHLQRHHPEASPQQPDDGYCPHCGRGDAGPTADQYEELRRRARQDAVASRESERILQQQIDRQAAELDRLQAMERHAQGARPLRNIQGRCPACRGESLFLADGNYITCSRLDCPAPDAASKALEPKETTP